MIPRIDNRTYTNLVLTVIAIVLVASAVKESGLRFLPTAQAQLRTQAHDLARTATGVPIDDSIPQSQDVAVAAATSEVAASNREIAEALREVAAALRDGMSDLRTTMDRRGDAAAGAAGAAPARATERPVVEVE